MSATLSARGYDSDRLSASVLRILASNMLCSMATRGISGSVHISTAFFGFDHDLLLYFLSHPESVHCRNLARLPQIAVAVFDSHQGWGEPHTGLQLFGTGGLADREDGRAARTYGARFPRYRELVRGTPEERPTSVSPGALKLYHVVPQSVQILDEWEFGEDVFIPATVVR
jgi:uncharacterized protein YhbP (UPF0306 family)